MAWKTDTDLENSDPLPDSGDVEWPCKPIVESSGWPTGWQNDSSKSKLKTPLPTAEDEAANKSQFPALLKVAEYLNSTLSLDDDDEFAEYIGEDGDYFINGDEGFLDGEDGLQDYDFFVKLFKQDDGLRVYYEKNRENGVFCCLVCCGVREKGWKRFKDCSSLVQHSISIAKTSKRRAHRAYCKVVCEILGWDVNSLPSIVLSAGNKLGESSDKPVQGNVDDGGDNGLSGQCKSTSSVSITDTEVSLSKLSLVDENQQGKDCCSAELEHNSLSGATADKSLGDRSKGTSDTTKENAEGENSVSKAGVDGLLKDLSYLTLETRKGNAKGASDGVVRCLVKKLGNPPIWHSFREGNKLATEDSNRSPLHQPVFLLHAPPWIVLPLQLDKDGYYIRLKKSGLLVCNSLGNLSIINSNVIASGTANYGVTATNVF